MEKTIIRSERLGIEVCRIKHDSGLTMLLCPMEGFSTARAICLPAPTGFRNRSKSCWILSAGPILPKRRCRRSRELSDRKSGCTMTAGTGG